MTINNRGLSGQPGLPYVDFRSYQGADIFIDMTFLDHTNTPQIPTSASYELDDLTNAVQMIQQTSIVGISASTYTLQIPGSLMQMTHNWQGSQVCQLWMTAVLPDTSTIQSIAIIELIAIQTPQSS